MQNKKISVIVPIYNVKDYLEQCLNSIIKQTYQNLEIILIDDGSTDGSSIICDRYKKMDARIKVMHKKNEGLVRARKEGVNLAIGDYIGYVDADDWIEYDMYEKLYNNLVASEADIIAAGRLEEYPERTLRCENIVDSKIYEGESLKDLYSKMIYSGEFFKFGLYPTVWDKLFKREILERNQLQIPDDIVIGEDVACVYPCMLEATSICVLDACFYHYRQREGSMLRTKDAGYIERIAVLYQYLCQRCKESEYWELLKPQIDLYMVDMVVSGARNMYNLNFIMVNDYAPYLFPFQDVSKGSNIVLYGAGKVGKIYHRQIEYTKYCKIVCWIDKEANKYENQGCRIDSLTHIKNISYDQIVIGIKNREIAREVIENLKDMGINESKIVWHEPTY